MGNPILRDLRLSCKLSASQIVEAVQTVHPKFDKPLLSKCEHAEDYGVQPLPSTIKAARSLAPDWKPKHADRHKHRFTLRCRMDADVHGRFMERIKQDGYQTAQAWIMAQVLAYLEGGTSDAANP